MINENSQMDTRQGFWNRWTNMKGYTSLISEYLALQNKLCNSILEKQKYSGVLESGCGDGSYLFENIISFGIRYYGVDYACDAIDALEDRIELLNLRDEQAFAICDDIHHIDNIIKSYMIPSSNLVCFPFNNLGMLEKPKDVLSKISQFEMDILIFTYNTDEYTNRARLDYYHKSGFTNVRYHKTPNGYFFDSEDDLYSHSYRDSVIKKWLHANNYLDIKVTSFSKIGMMYYATI